LIGIFAGTVFLAGAGFLTGAFAGTGFFTGATALAGTGFFTGAFAGAGFFTGAAALAVAGFLTGALTGALTGVFFFNCTDFFALSEAEFFTDATGFADFPFDFRGAVFGVDLVTAIMESRNAIEKPGLMNHWEWHGGREERGGLARHLQLIKQKVIKFLHA
jgi:hypothetical protein